MQEDFCRPGAPLFVACAPDIVPVLANLIARWRKEHVAGRAGPVIYARREHAADGSDVDLPRREYFKSRGGFLVVGTKGAEIIAALKPGTGDILITKPRWSAFFETSLASRLRQLGLTGVYLTGVNTANCVRATVYDALSHDFHAVVVEDCCASSTEEVQQANLRDLRAVAAVISSAEVFG